MDDEAKEREAREFRRRHWRLYCRSCGAIGVRTLRAEEMPPSVYTLPGLSYRYCGSWGDSDPIVRRTRKNSLCFSKRLD